MTGLSRCNAGVAQLTPEPTRREQHQHTKIADQRPARMAESLRPIALEDEMAEPSRSIADHRGGEQKAPIALGGGRADCRQCQGGAEIMQPARAPVGMRREIAPPKLRISHDMQSLYCTARHRKSPAIIAIFAAESRDGF